MMDDPRHHHIRRLVTPAVAPRALALLEGELRARTAAILDAVAEEGAATSSSTWPSSCPCRPPPCSWGYPNEDRHDLMAWSNATSPTTTASSGTERSAAAGGRGRHGRLRLGPDRAQAGSTGATTCWPRLCRATVDG